VVAAIIGVLATVGAVAFQLLGGGTHTALEWSVYDHWLRAHPAAPASPRLVVVVRDPASEASFGTGTWDRAVLARIIGNVARSGAAAIGVDIPLGQTSAPARGGAASDALLTEATVAADVVVFPIALEALGPRASTGDGRVVEQGLHRSWASAPPKEAVGWVEARPLDEPLPGLAHSARAIGHTLVWPDPDGVVRRVPLFVQVGRAFAPAFAVALGAVADDVKPTARHEVPRTSTTTLVRYVGPGLPSGVSVVPISEVWRAIDDGQRETLHAMFDDKIAILLAHPPGPPRATPLGPMPDAVIQTHALNMLLTRSWLREVQPIWIAGATLLIATLVAWLWVALRRWWGLIGAIVIGAACAGVIPVALGRGVVLPAATPLAAIALATAGALVWNHLASRHRIQHLEGEVEGVQRELSTVREALVRHESTVEALEEDVEAARVAVARSTGAERELSHAAEALRTQLAEARAQEVQTRIRLLALERELQNLRPGDTPAADLGDTEADRLRRDCERVGILTRDPAVLALFRDLQKAARASLPILIAGEPGTGKELFARAAHLLGPRAEHPFVAVNMAAIPPELFESQLFGHVKGSFTGAVADRKGSFEQADRGTIFLDEIGDLRPDHQSKLLRVLQEKSFYRVGASRPTTVDVRIVAASNRDLERGIAEGWFREDLYFRLKGLVLRLPPLRERPRDVRLLATRFTGHAAAELGRDGVTLSEGAERALDAHDWPGNVRELQQCLRQAVALADRPVITETDLRLRPRPLPPDAGTGSDDDAVLARLRQYGFDMQATARALDWDRSTVTQRLKGLGFRALVEARGDREKAAAALAGDPALTRTVELKLREYHEHLLRSLQPFDSPEVAIAAFRRRFKNLPERHFRSLESLVRQHFDRRPS
jgi:DNA-binding NtrC family response regulator/CHASE2 domain-containing sensor protein